MDKQLREDQRRFAMLGLYDSAKIDGLYGRRTAAAIDAYCEKEGIELEAPDDYRDLTPDPYRLSLWEKINALKPREYYDADSLLPELIKVATALYLTLPEQIAYLMATVEHETAKQFYPVEEGYWMAEEARQRYLSKKKYGQHINGQQYYGRGLVQLTWESNYRKYQDITGVPLVRSPQLTMEPRLSLLILVHGMKTGTFTGVGLEQFINPWRKDFPAARRTVNGMDKAAQIASLAQQWVVKIQAMKGAA